MPADGILVEHQVTVMLAAENELATRDLKRLASSITFATMS